MKKRSYDLPHITKKQREIMHQIYKFRFLNRIQIQTILKHKDYKRINVWLKDLMSKGYLFRIYERKIPLNIKPAVYFAAPTGVRFIGQEWNYEANHKLYREKERSEQFRDKCSTIANLYIDTFKKTETINALNFFKTKQEFDEYDKTIEPYPDSLISLKTSPAVIYDYLNQKIKLTTTLRKIKKGQKNKEDYLYFLEIIGEKIPRYYLRYRVQQYIEYSDRKGPTTEHYIVLFVLPNKLTQKFLLKFIEKRLEYTLFEPHLIFASTTTNLLQNNGMIAGIWTVTDK